MEQFGILDGAPIQRIRIANDSLMAHILNYGAVVQDLRLASVPHPLVLGFDHFEHYPLHSQSFGILAGRHANRIKDGHLPLGADVWQLDRNENDVTHLHGGGAGTGSRVWDVVSSTQNSVHLHILCEHGEMGYPGNLTIDCYISISDPATLVFEITAVTDATTVCNLAPHSYFNLDGTNNIGNHHLQIIAEHYLPVDPQGIPTGQIAAVAGTDFDFRAHHEPAMPRTLDTRLSSTAFDHNYCLHTQRRELSLAARLGASKANERSVVMDVYTTEPGLQFYDGSKLDVPVAGLDGRHYCRHTGLCLEPQRWPDSMHYPSFAGAVLHPGEQYHQRSEYRLTTA
ncbi:MAG: aldose epimerase family protein [Granulosicoccaceae bacterium]